MNKEPLDLRPVRRSDLYGFWKRLKVLGFVPYVMWSKPYHVDYNSYLYTKTYWSFSKDDTRVIFMISSHGYILRIKRKRKTQLKVGKRCWSALERPFMRYFKQTRPLAISRLGRQRKPIRKWLEEQDIKKRKRKNAKAIRTINIRSHKN